MTRLTLTAVACATLIIASFSPSVVRASGVVGTGTAGSCTDAALDIALSGGGLVTFNCGGPATIDVSTGTGTKTISADTTINGGSLITISGGHSVGVFSVNTGVKFTVQNLTIANGSGGNGGGIASNGTLTVTNSTFTGNSASGNGDGGAIYNNGTLTVTNSTFGSSASFSGNQALFGGGIFSNGTLTVVTNSTFFGNHAYGGAGIYNAGPLTVTNSTFSGNIASYDGGGIDNTGPLTVTNSTFSGNIAFGSLAYDGGGGIYNGGGPLTVTNSTFSGNSASAGRGGGIDKNGGTLTMTNTIVANSTSGGNCSGTITDGGHNIDDGGSCGFSGTSLSNTNPMLDPAGLANNGGPTQTVAICTGTGTPSAGCTGASPAINAGDESVCSTTTGTAPVDNLDQRSFVRPGTGATNCSIGAFEASSEAREGFVPPDANTGRCEDLVARHLRTLSGCMTKCQIKQADAALKGESFDEEACEQGTGKPVSCRTAYNNATTKLLGRRPAICPTCLAATAQSNLGDLVVNFIENNSGLIYCAGTTSLGGDDTGFVPPDANTGKCEDLAATHLKTLSACMTKCQIKQADAARRGNSFDEEACEQGTGKPVSCRTAYNNATTKLLGRVPAICPACLDAMAQSNLGDLVVNFIENNNGLIYCAGTTPLP